MNLDKEFLNLLACPACRGEVEPLQEGETINGLHCPKCALVYPVRENIPVMLKEEGIALPEWQNGKREARRK